MNPTLIALGLVLVVAGAGAAKFPMHLRSFTSARIWQGDPERAERYQRVFGHLVAAVIGGIGLGTATLGLVTG